MTGPDDDVTAALARTFRQHAGEVPPADDLPERVVALAGRRRRQRRGASIAAVLVLAVGIPAAVVATVDGGGARTAEEVGDPTWRWESYRGVQVRVPPDWGYGVAHEAWCAGGTEGEPVRVRAGAVGRPADLPAIGCGTDDPPADERENWLAFDHRDREGERRVDHGWVEETRRVGGVYLSVFSDDAELRSEILATARAIPGTDEYGCPTGHPVVTDPDGYRPEAAQPSGAVESISVCRYSLEPRIAPPLLGSRRVTGTAATDAVAAIRSAPEGEGPESGDPDSHGTEIVVLRVATTHGTREVVVRYSGSRHNGFDDGTTRHRLTADAVRPLLTGPARPSSFKIGVADLFDE